MLKIPRAPALHLTCIKILCGYCIIFAFVVLRRFAIMAEPVMGSSDLQ
jgi:hypothetical protein